MHRRHEMADCKPTVQLGSVGPACRSPRCQTLNRRPPPPLLCLPCVPSADRCQEVGAAGAEAQGAQGLCGRPVARHHRRQAAPVIDAAAAAAAAPPATAAAAAAAAGIVPSQACVPLVFLLCYRRAAFTVPAAIITHRFLSRLLAAAAAACSLFALLCCRGVPGILLAVWRGGGGADHAGPHEWALPWLRVCGWRLRLGWELAGVGCVLVGGLLAASTVPLYPATPCTYHRLPPPAHAAAAPAPPSPPRPQVCDLCRGRERRGRVCRRHDARLGGQAGGSQACHPQGLRLRRRRWAAHTVCRRAQGRCLPA